MDINGSVNIHAQAVTALRNDPNTSDAHHQAARIQKETQSIDKVTTEQPTPKTTSVSEDVVGTRLSEFRSFSADKPIAANETIGSLIDMSV